MKFKVTEYNKKSIQGRLTKFVNSCKDGIYIDDAMYDEPLVVDNVLDVGNIVIFIGGNIVIIKKDKFVHKLERNIPKKLLYAVTDKECNSVVEAYVFKIGSPNKNKRVYNFQLLSDSLLNTCLRQFSPRFICEPDNPVNCIDFKFTANPIKFLTQDEVADRCAYIESVINKLKISGGNDNDRN